MRKFKLSNVITGTLCFALGCYISFAVFFWTPVVLFILSLFVLTYSASEALKVACISAFVGGLLVMVTSFVWSYLHL